VFFPDKPTKGRSVTGGAPFRCTHLCRFVALLSNIRLGWKGKDKHSSLFVLFFVMKKKSFFLTDTWSHIWRRMKIMKGRKRTSVSGTDLG
jgi:hypothetical protein